MNDSTKSTAGGHCGLREYSKGALSLDRRRLIELIQEISFGRIEQLIVRGGEPVLEPPPRIVHTVKFGGQNGPREERTLDDFTLKRHIVELFDEFDHLCDGVINVLTVKHGLPFNMEVNLAPLTVMRA